MASADRTRYHAEAIRGVEETRMSIDPFGEELPGPRPDSHVIGQDLSHLSIEELDERIAALETEIGRLREAKGRKLESKTAADAFFKAGG